METEKIISDTAARCAGSPIAVYGGEQFFDSLSRAAEGTGIALSRGEGCAAIVEEGEECPSELPCIVVPAREGDLAREQFAGMLKDLLFAFPVAAIDVVVPGWVRSLPADNSAVSELVERVLSRSREVKNMSDCAALASALEGCEGWEGECALDLSLSDGRATLRANIRDGAFFALLSETAGEDIADEGSLMSFAVSAAQARREYSRIRGAFERARATGYGIVPPDDGEMKLEKPQVIRRGGGTGVKLKAAAPSYHIIRVDVDGEVSPILGQTDGGAGGLPAAGEDMDEMWNANIFGRTLRDVVKENLAGRAGGMQEEVRSKLRRAITRIVNEGKGGVICILL